jgi:hypothetical protein
VGEQARRAQARPLAPRRRADGGPHSRADR